MIIKPKNWRDFQHYKDRSPPWIRLHRGLLDDFDFQCLPVASRALAPMLWLLASCSDDLQTGQFDASPQKMAFRLRMTEAEFIDALKPLISAGFFVVVQDASNVLATRLHDAVPETETETETETEQRPRKRAPTKSRIPDDFVLSDRVRAWAAEKGYGQLDQHIDHFRMTCAAKGYTYADWDSALMRAISDNWAKVSAVVTTLPAGGRKKLA